MQIRLEQITKSFGDLEVIPPLTATFEAGQLTTLLGPSGCGKTTLLRIIAGLENPDQGRIYFGDRCVFSSDEKINVPPEERGLGFVFQDFALWPHMTVFENVAFGLRSKGDTYQLDRRVQQALETVALGDFENRYPRQLSGGQQQRVAFARALVIEPAWILFDEPLSALDAVLREQMRVEIRRIIDHLGLSALFVTHDQLEAMSMSDQIMVLSNGQIEQYDRPERIYHHPQTAFVANFVGDSNWLDEHRMVRPEQVHLEPPVGRENYQLHTVVKSSQFVGKAYQLLLDYQGKNWLCEHHQPLSEGTPLTVYIAQDDMITMS